MVGLNTTVSRPLKVTVNEPGRVKITKVSASDELIEVKLTEGDPAGSATYEVTVKGTDKIGRLTGKVQVAFTGGGVASVDVPVRGQVVGDLNYPQSISFNRRQGSFGERDVVFTSRTKKDVELLAAEDPANNLSVQITQAKGKTAKIHVKVGNAQGASANQVRGHLVIKTTDPVEPEVKIAYGIYFKKGRIDRSPAARPTRRLPKRRGIDVRNIKPPGQPK